MDTSGLWGSLAFVSNLEMSGNASICRKLFPVWRRCTFMGCLHISMSINIFTEMGGRKFQMERHRKNEERKIAPSMIVSVPRNAVNKKKGEKMY